MAERPRRRAGLAWGLLALIALLGVLDVWLGLRRPAGAAPFDIGTVAFEGTFLCLAPVGALIASRRPAHPIGWLMLTIGLLMAVLGILAESSRQFYGPQPELGAALFIASDALSKAVFLLFGVLLLLFPTGHLPSRRWRPLVAGAVLAIVLSTALEVVTPSRLADYAMTTPPDNPFGIRALNPIANAIDSVLFVYFFGFLLLSAASVALRFRRADPELRLQLKWFWLAASILIATHAAGNVFLVLARGGRGWVPAPIQLVELGAAAALAAAIAIAILRHRLFDIELAISRTVAYGGLTAVITAFYIAVVAGIGSLLATGSTSRLVLATIATAVVAAAFQPLRAGLERVADRVVYGNRAVPYEVLADFTARLDATHNSMELLPVMARMLAEGTRCDGATVWLRDRGVEVLASSFPQHQLVPVEAATRTVPVQYAGTSLGRLAVVRRSGQPLTPTEERLMDGLASQTGLVLHNAGLQDELSRRLVELRESRHRLLSAQDEARRRLERDLHDGAQQNLISLRMKLGLAAATARDKPEQVEPLLEEMQNEVGQALDSLRTLARGIYPPLLEAEGLRAALRARARQLTVVIDVQCGTERYPREIEGAVYFFCSEALQNVAKHSHATRGTVQLCNENRRLRFEVRDNGCGFDPDATTAGDGLQGMRDRLDVLGGAFEVSSAPGAGVTVAGWLPLS